MIRKILLPSICFTLGSLPVIAQQDGYFQQEVNTTIEVTLDDEQHILRGHISMDYINYSNDTLSYIYMHIYPNAYSNKHTAYAKQMMQNGSSAFMKLSNEDLGGIDSLSFSIMGRPTTIQYTEHVDVIKVMLSRPLLPQQMTQISTPFRVKLPKMTSRLGHIGQSYQVTQWFPKPAVYDKNGWNAFPYLNFGEYYSEYGTYDVSITVPKNYIVMATGNLQNKAEQQWLDSLAALPDSVYLAKAAAIPSSKEMKTLKFTESNIHDFAWFADKNWMVRQERFVIPENNKEVTATACYYKDDASSNGNSIKYLRQAILGYSKFVGPYPFATVKSVTGPLSAGGGMEYPTITIIDAFDNAGMVEQVIVHEVGHNWFYGILGNNERNYPFMDESINSYYEARVIDYYKYYDINDSAKQIYHLPSGIKPKNIKKYIEQDTFKKESTYVYSEQISNNNINIENIVINQMSAANRSMPVCQHSAHYPEINYGVDIYQKGALYFKYLAAYLGQDNFDKAMQHYFQEWQYKHPQPDDFYTSLQSQANKPIDWFFKDAIMAKSMPDFKLSQASKTDLVVTHNHKYALPVGIDIYNNQDSVIQTIWTEPFQQQLNIRLDTIKDYAYAVINKVVPNEQYSNDASNKRVKLKPFLGLSIKPEYNIYLSAALGYNIYDKFMIGGLLHNMTVPAKRLEFAIAPMYGVGSNKLVYTGLVNYFIPINNSWLNDVNITWNGKKFSEQRYNLLDEPTTQYFKNKLGATFGLKTDPTAFHLSQQLHISYNNISQNGIQFNYQNGTLQGYEQKGYNARHLWNVSYLLQNARRFYPYSLKLEVLTNSDNALLIAEGNYKINYNGSSKGIKLRGFVGGLIHWDPSYENPGQYLNIVGSGWNDYLYDHTFIGRNERSGILSNQSTLTMGGFYTHNKLNANQVGVTNSYLLALNADIAIPKTPFSIFANLAYTGPVKMPDFNMDNVAVHYEAGIALHLMDRFTIALPIFLSPELNDYRKYILGKNKIGKSIAFRMDLNDLVPSRKATKSIFGI